MFSIKKYVVAFYLMVFFNQLVVAQQNPLVSGPWAGNVQMRTAVIWAEVGPSVKKVAVEFVEKNNPANRKVVTYNGPLGLDFNPVKITLNGLQFNTTYNYTLVIDGKKVALPFATQFTTQDLWQWRKPAPDFSFLAGSCAYFNEPIYDRPGKPYGDTDSIFYTMANTAAAFHVWMGDNWYTREVDYNDAWGLNYRASHDRAQKALQPFMASMPQYAIWDDHDYGPNDAGKSYILKNESRNIFKNYMLNPSYGEDEKGIYTKISYCDVDVFLTDDRFFRSEDEMPDSVNGQPSPQKHFFGPAQMEWLQNQLSFSNATFKIIVVGSQVLNPLDKAESMQRYPYEYQQLLQFITNQKINGVLFFTGDRHHSEVVKMDQPQQYPLYDVTISPYTSGVSKVTDVEKNSPYRIANTLVEAQNFGKISVSGTKNNRMLRVDFVGVKGTVLGTWSVQESELIAK